MTDVSPIVVVVNSAFFFFPSFLYLPTLGMSIYVVPNYLSNKFKNNDIRRFGSYIGPPTTSSRSPEPKDKLAILFPVSIFGAVGCQKV